MEDGFQNKKVAFIIQARMQSTRLPGKILMPLPIGSKLSILSRIIQLLKTAKTKGAIYIATSENEDNDILQTEAASNQINFFRGSEENVLSRFISICNNSDFDVIVRLTGDNPILDIPLLDDAIEKHITTEADYTSTSGLPLGMNFEIVNVSALLSLQDKVLTDDDNEHVTLHIKNSVDYSCNVLKLFSADKYSGIRVTVDYPSDYLIAATLYVIHEATNIPVGISLIDYAIKNHPYIFEINRYNYQKVSGLNLEQEIEAATPILEQLEFKKILSFLDDSKVDGKLYKH